MILKNNGVWHAWPCAKRSSEAEWATKTARRGTQTKLVCRAHLSRGDAARTHTVMCMALVSNLKHREEQRHRGHLEQLSHTPVKELEVGVCRGVLRALAVIQHDWQENVTKVE